MKFIVERSSYGDPLDVENLSRVRNLVTGMRTTYPNCIIEVHTRYKYEGLVFNAKFDVYMILKNINILSNGRNYAVDVQESLKQGVAVPIEIEKKEVLKCIKQP